MWRNPEWFGKGTETGRRVLDWRQLTLGGGWPRPRALALSLALAGMCREVERQESQPARTQSSESGDTELSWSSVAGQGSLRVGELVTLVTQKLCLGWLLGRSHLKCKTFCLQRTPVSHKVIEKRRRDRINRCLNELGKTVPMALAKQVTFVVLGTPPLSLSAESPKSLQTLLA